MVDSAKLSIFTIWMTALAVTCLLMFMDYIHLDGMVIDNSSLWGRDFLNVWTAGRLHGAGRLDIIYDMEAYQAFQQMLTGAPLNSYNYSYPPLGLPLTIPFGLLPYPWALFAWLSCTGGLFICAARPWLNACGLPALAAFVLPAALINIWTGHYGFLFGALWLFAWRALDEGRDRRGGILIGLMAIKPHLALLIPVILLCRRRWTAILFAAFTVAALIAISILLYGPELWAAYLGRTSGEQVGMIDAGTSDFGAMSTSTATALFRAGAGSTVAWIGQLLTALVGLGLVISAAIRKAPIGQVGLLAATATFLILPYAFVYDLTVSSLAALILIATRWQDIKVVQRALLIGGFGAAAIGFAMALFLRLPITPLLLLGLALVQYRLLITDPAAPAAAAAAR